MLGCNSCPLACPTVPYPDESAHTALTSHSFPDIIRPVPPSIPTAYSPPPQPPFSRPPACCIERKNRLWIFSGIATGCDSKSTYTAASLLRCNVRALQRLSLSPPRVVPPANETRQLWGRKLSKKLASHPPGRPTCRNRLQSSLGPSLVQRRRLIQSLASACRVAREDLEIGWLPSPPVAAPLSKYCTSPRLFNSATSTTTEQAHTRLLLAFRLRLFSPKVDASPSSTQFTCHSNPLLHSSASRPEALAYP